MEIPYYQINAFSDGLSSGNPAGVCFLNDWLDELLLQRIATENNLSETAFVIHKKPGLYDIRWFTPATEVNLCGHATLAAAHAIFANNPLAQTKIEFLSKSGSLYVDIHEDMLFLDFPADHIKEVEIPSEGVEAFHGKALAAFRGRDDYMIICSNQEEIKYSEPDLSKLIKLDCRGVIFTAQGNEVDFVSRFFGPQSGIDEDPVTGSAHTTLMPYWSKKLGKNKLNALQLSKRQGKLFCELKGDRVLIGGKAHTYMKGTILV